MRTRIFVLALSAMGLAACASDTLTLDAATSLYFASLPETATYYGIPETAAPGASARLTDRSPAAEARRRREIERVLGAAEAAAKAAPNDDGAASLAFLLDAALEPGRRANFGTAFGAYGVAFLPYVINHNSGPTVDIPSILEAQHTIATRDDAEAYLARLSAIGATLDGALESFRRDVARGAGPPDFIVARSREFVDAFAAAPAAENVLYTSFIEKTARAGLAGGDDYAARALALIESSVRPAYRRVGDYLREIEAAAPHDAGVWRLPGGEAFYAAMIWHMTDTDLTPAELHATGLAEVDRILAETDARLRALGRASGNVGARMRALAAEPAFAYPNDATGRARVLADINAQIAAVTAAAPAYFGALPQAPLEVRAVPAFSEATAAGGYYDAPSADGARPGIYWINLRDTAAYPTFKVPTLTYHEAIPGHHLQAAASLATPAATPLASIIYSNAVGEGWALYAEALASEMGLYADDPYGDLGRLQDELHRAIRLVVDTGMHAMRWSREDAIAYMMKTQGAEEAEAVSEIERYVTGPAQALGYKVGMLRILDLRRAAEARLGSDFDLKAFHAAALGVSSYALPVVERRLGPSFMAAPSR